MSPTKLPTTSKVFLALMILGLTSGVLPGQGKDGPKTITIPALVQSSESVEIHSRITGLLKKQTVDIGDKVAKGQILAEIDAPVVVREVQQAVHALELNKAQFQVMEALIVASEAAVKEARGRIEQRESDLQAARANLKFRLEELKRFKILFERNTIEASMVNEQSQKTAAAEAGVQTAQALLLQAKHDTEVKMGLALKAKAELDVHKARIRVGEAALDLAQVRLGFTRIIAPFDGVITRRQFSTGDLIRAGDHVRPAPMFVLQRIDRMRVIVQIPSNSASLVQAGAKVELTIPNLADPIQGTIARTAVAIEEGTMRAEMDVVNTGNLRPGMTGRATIQLGTGK